MAEAGPELSVVCKNCGSEVSPYVTECPYCGTRLRKRAPKLERVGDEVRVREDRKAKRRRKAAERRERAGRRPVRERSADLTARPLVAIAVIAVSAIVLVIERATNLDVVDLGAIVVVGDEWWRYLAAPFVYDDTGYLFACALAIAIFVPPIERRIGTFATLMLVLGCGGLGMLAADGFESLVGEGFVFAAGGNGIALGALAAFVVLREPERRADPEEGYDPIPVAIAAIVLLCLPLVDDFASASAGVAGGLVGALCGLAATLGSRGARER